MRPISPVEIIMPLPLVRDFEARDLPAIARLLAERQQRDLEAGPAGFNRALTDPAVCERVLEQNYLPVLEIAVAEINGEVVGWLGGQRNLVLPTSYVAHYVEPHSMTMPSLGHAVSADVDAVVVYRSLYGFLAERWVRNGYFVHQVYVIPSDALANEAWHALGFGRKMTAAVRDLSPVEYTGRRPDIRAATSEDLEVVFQLNCAISVHESLAPMFTPYARKEIDPDMREHVKQVMAEPATVPWLAYEDSQAIGMQFFCSPGYTPFHIQHAGTVYLYGGVVTEASRGSGTGTALLAHSMDWARDAGYERCVLHFHSSNWSGGPFWQGHGFVPIEHMLIRRLDERIAWAREW